MSTDNIEALLSQITVTLTQDSTIVVKQRVTDIGNLLSVFEEDMPDYPYIIPLKNYIMDLQTVTKDYLDSLNKIPIGISNFIFDIVIYISLLYIFELFVTFILLNEKHIAGIESVTKSTSPISFPNSFNNFFILLNVSSKISSNSKVPLQAPIDISS